MMMMLMMGTKCIFEQENSFSILHFGFLRAFAFDPFHMYTLT